MSLIGFEVVWVFEITLILLVSEVGDGSLQLTIMVVYESSYHTHTHIILSNFWFGVMLAKRDPFTTLN